ncbi:uncharacterized protein LOC132605413 isoform X2 [Lycium barbarum]|uniref:uncharacterized protein LOC132605413 isoform X2 n=1 Tax=Lycium barbarum TaxID=112863 RepID=UPI00293E1A0F|nr:uncharacterized protein LOC132605413 isoform X2 [Lycium barbarum]
MELANRAIQEYNEKECNVFKYKVLKIQKVNLMVTSYYEYWMTVKVLNLTLGTPIETFQIHAGKHCRNDDAKVIYCCQPKEEAVVGLVSCVERHVREERRRLKYCFKLCYFGLV